MALKTLPAIIMVLAMCLVRAPAHATEEYSELTGKGCVHCHLDPSGGAELTAAGKAYFAGLTLSEEGGPETGSKSGFNGVFHYIRLAAGYLHILMGLFWFGTILYVHLILKPAYAAHGLPRGEVRLGLVSIIIMAVTGTILTFARVPSPAFLFETRFGILLTIKIFLFLIMTGTAVFVVAVLGPKLKGDRVLPGDGIPNAMTLEQLRAYDGSEGRPAYFAFAGKVYDASRSPHWIGGRHFGRHNAGQDLTETIGQAPHDEDKVLEMKQVGEISEAREKTIPPRPTRVFFLLAYLNLALVLLITLILALWRWW